MKRIACSLMVALPALAHAADLRPVDLPPGQLGEAIVALGRDSGASIRLADPSLWQRPTPAVQGRLSTAVALARLVAGSGMEVVRVGVRSWVVRIARRRAEPALPSAVEAPAPDIVVTGSKRATRLADYAGTVAILSGSDLAAPGPAGSGALGDRLASVTSTHLGAGRDKLFIRGIADSGLVGQSQATVGQYLGDLRLTYSAPDPGLRLYDIGSVEVLEGPQGTLYGAGSPGGIIRLVRNAPALERFEASLGGGIGATAHGAASGDGVAMLNLPILSGRAALRVLGYGDRVGGYIDALGGARNINRVDTVGGRAVLRLAPADGWTVDLGGVVQRIRGRDAQYADEDLPSLTRRSTLPQPYGDSYRMAEVTVARSWSTGLRFVSSNAATWQDVTERYDVRVDPAVAQLFRQHNRTRMVASENRLSRPMRDGWGWVAGVSLLRNTTRLTRAIGAPDQPLPTAGVLNRLEEQTGFGELSVEPLDGLILTGGARITHSRLTGKALSDATPLRLESVIAARGSRSETRLLPSASLSVRPAQGWLLYTRYQQGFRPGGLGIGDGTVQRFDGDRVATIEWGMRLDRPGAAALSLAASAAYTRWTNVQADFLDLSGLPVTTNIGDGRIWSFDARAAVRPMPGWRVELSILVNDSRLTRPDILMLTRFRLNAAVAEIRENLPNVAQLGGRAALDWHRRLVTGVDLDAGAWARYVGRSRLGIGPTLGRVEGDYVDTGLSARVGWSSYGVTVSARNLLDVAGNRFALGTPLNFVGSREITPLAPRTVRIGFDMRL